MKGQFLEFDLKNENKAALKYSYFVSIPVPVYLLVSSVAVFITRYSKTCVVIGYWKWTKIPRKLY